jgi:hypothetical protein
MQQARSAKYDAPTKAAVTAQLAVAISILTFAPIRLSNLVNIELGKNLIKPGGVNSPFWLVFEHYDVKNRVDLNFKFDQPLTDLIEEYVHEFRPTLLHGTNASWLFPGEGGKPKTHLGVQLTERIQKAVGLRITQHQFRHAAAAIYLKHQPGAYEVARRLLDTAVSRRRSISTRPADHAGDRAVRKSHSPADQIWPGRLKHVETSVTTASRRSGRQRARSVRCRWISGPRLIAVPGTWLAVLRCASSEGAAGHLKPVTRNDLSNATATFWIFSTARARADRTDRPQRM